MTILRTQLKHVRNLSNDAIAIMDEKGRSNPEDTSQLLWSDQWEYLRNKVFEIENIADKLLNIFGAG